MSIRTPVPAVLPRFLRRRRRRFLRKATCCRNSASVDAVARADFDGSIDQLRQRSANEATVTSVIKSDDDEPKNPGQN